MTSILGIHLSMKLHELLDHAQRHELSPETEILVPDEHGDPVSAAITDPADFDDDDPLKPAPNQLLLEPEAL